MNRVVSAALLAGWVTFSAAASAADIDTSSLSCAEGFKPKVYDEPKEGTKPWRDKHVRCEKPVVNCPYGMKAVYHDTEVYGSTPLDGKFVRCEDAMLPGAKPP